MRKKRLPKSTEQQIQDLLDYHFCLGRDIQDYEQGHLSRLKTILCILRVLVCDKELAFVVGDFLGIKPALTFYGRKGFPATNPLSKDRTISLEDYIRKADNGFMLGTGEMKSNQYWVYNYASQDGSHSDSCLDPYIANKEAVLINGNNSLDLQIISIAKNIYVSIEAMIQEAIKKGIVSESDIETSTGQRKSIPYDYFLASRYRNKEKILPFIKRMRDAGKSVYCFIESEASVKHCGTVECEPEAAMKA